VIGIKTWIYKGEILDLTKRRGGLLPEPEPRRESRDRRERMDRGDRGGRGRDRGDRGPSQAPPAADLGGPAIQTPPSDLPRPAARPTAPILPPLMSPQAPSWKQEARHETPAATPETEAKPADTSSDKPEGTGENQ
jgi:small subunit ribosomal protein S3